MVCLSWPIVLGEEYPRVAANDGRLRYLLDYAECPRDTSASSFSYVIFCTLLLAYLFDTLDQGRRPAWDSTGVLTRADGSAREHLLLDAQGGGKADPGKSNAAPQSGAVLPDQAVALVDVDRLDNRRCEGQSNAGAELECRVDLEIDQSLWSRFDGGEERQTMLPHRLFTLTGTLANMMVLVVTYMMLTPATPITDVGNTCFQLRSTQIVRRHRSLQSYQGRSLQIDITLPDETTRYGSNHAQAHAGEQKGLHVESFHDHAREQGYEEAHCPHRKEPNCGLACRILVHFLGDENEIVKDCLVASVHDWSVEDLARDAVKNTIGESLTEPSDPEPCEVLDLPQRKRHHRVADLLLETSEHHDQCYGDDKQGDDEGFVPAVDTATGEDKGKQNESAR